MGEWGIGNKSLQGRAAGRAPYILTLRSLANAQSAISLQGRVWLARWAAFSFQADRSWLTAFLGIGLGEPDRMRATGFW